MTLILSGSLPMWAQQLASIIPLAALIEFIDISHKLHVFELTGAVPLWGWPVTPAGARLLLSSEDTEHACNLDSPERSAVLECFDGRHGDRYPSSTPTTTRLWCSAHSMNHVVDNTHENMRQPGMRPQRLEFFRLTDRAPLSSRAVTGKAIRRGNHISTLLAETRSGVPRYIALSIFGWLGLTTLLVLSFVHGLWVAAAYLIIVPFTGLMICNTHGSGPRQLLNGNERGRHDRVVVAAGSINSPVWWAFYGESMSTNSLLNRPLRRNGTTYWPRFSRLLLQTLIVGQWALVLASSALINWNAYIISIWIIFCALASSHLYSPDVATQDWLWYKCNIEAKRIRADFSSRRAMLSALVYINPDTAEGRTAWIDPILSRSSPDRQEWETALLQYIKQGKSVDAIPLDKHWRKWIVEGVEMGEKIKVVLWNAKRQPHPTARVVQVQGA